MDDYSSKDYLNSFLKYLMEVQSAYLQKLGSSSNWTLYHEH
jgi:hypothetical protein